MTPPPRRVALCADDFGMSAGVDRGILLLARAGRVTAVSCMAGAPCFPEHAAELVTTRVDLGVHLEFADGDGGSGRLLLRAGLGLVSRTGMRDRVARQVDRFRALTGKEPVFLDGHLHAHQFPVIRDALLDWLAAQPGPAPMLRTTAMTTTGGLKAWVLHGLGARFRAELDRRALPHNADFAGVYPFGAGAPYPVRMRGWLRDIRDGGLIMCHPSADPSEARVLHAAVRAQECDYLRSEAFARDCAEAGVARVGISALRSDAGGQP